MRPRTLAERKLLRESGGRILGGPFRGMQYHPIGTGDAWHQRMLGTYELEARDVLEEFIGRAPARVVNVGAADGFYAVGLAWRLPTSRVVAFETLGAKHSSIRSLATMNRVSDRLDVRSTCDHASLSGAIDDVPASTLIVMDVEGAELDLLDQDIIPKLADTSMLVEMHEALRPGSGETLQRRFGSTHQIVKIGERPRRVGDLPFDPGWLKPWMMSFTLENRAIRQEWWAFFPR